MAEGLLALYLALASRPSVARPGGSEWLAYERRKSNYGLPFPLYTKNTQESKETYILARKFI